jgi:hypothetical protein
MWKQRCKTIWIYKNITAEFGWALQKIVRIVLGTAFLIHKTQQMIHETRDLIYRFKIF